MDINRRVKLMVKAGEFIVSQNPQWLKAKEVAYHKNSWFIPDFINAAAENIKRNFLDEQILNQWIKYYHLDDNILPKTVGIIMAGNIPMVGFHDLLSVFICGHKQIIKLSSKDDVLLKSIVEFLASIENDINNYISFADSLQGCDAYIATGSNTSAEIFRQYFSKYPNIIRKGRTSVAVLSGNETPEQLNNLSDDVHMYFGRGCRSVTHLYVPQEYDFIPLLDSFKKYDYFIEHFKYKNNYDFQLSLVLMNKNFYMTNGTTILLEQESLFPPPAVVYYTYYDHENSLRNLIDDDNIQCVVGKNIDFGDSQAPGIFNYADDIDTMQFLLSL